MPRILKQQKRVFALFALTLSIVSLLSLGTVVRVAAQGFIFRVSGRVTDVGGSPIADVTIAFRLNSATAPIDAITRTDANGNYSMAFTQSVNSVYTIPSKAGLSFVPQSRGYISSIGLSGELTANFTSGKGFFALMNAAQVVPPTNSQGTGFGFIQLSADETKANVLINNIVNLSSTQTGVSIRSAPAGSNGPTLFTLPNSSSINEPAQINLTPSQVTELKAGRFYFLVHSANFPNGEIRGQVNPVITHIMIDPNSVMAARNVSEQGRSIEVNVIRENGERAATVDYATSNGTASDRSDYTAALGTLRFAPGEVSKSFSVFITDDAFDDSDENFNVTLSNATGDILAQVPAMTVTINDNDDSETGGNPVKDPTFDSAFFVRQHYLDFLNREPDAAGLAFWRNQIDECTTQECREVRRVNVSAAFFLSGEFQQTGYLVYLFNQAAFNTGERLAFRSFLRDTQQLGRGVVVGQAEADEILEANKRSFADEFVTRPAFVSQYPLTMSAVEFVDALNANTGGSLSAAERESLINRLGSGELTRAEVLRTIAEDPEFRARELNRAFVLMQYFGYLRRAPNEQPDTDLSGFNFWLNKLNEHNGNYIEAEMVKAFITSPEYQQRFGQ